MAYKVERNIVVPIGYVQNASGFVAPFRQVHLHSTANPSAPLDNEMAYLSKLDKAHLALPLNMALRYILLLLQTMFDVFLLLYSK